MEEDLNFIQHIKSFFIDQQYPSMPKPALSEHSTSNPTTTPNNIIPNQNDDMMNKRVEAKLNSQVEAVCNNFLPSELMELDPLLEFRVTSPEDGSNHLGSFPTQESMALCSAGLEQLQLQLPLSPGH